MSTTPPEYVRDRQAAHIAAPAGAASSGKPRTVMVIGGGIAGLAAACGLVERGIAVDLIEPQENLGGRVRAWQTKNEAGSVSMSRGFHAFFRQYYNLRALLSRAGDLDEILRPVEDYPVVSARGDRDSFTKIPRTPPFNFISFVMQSPTFTAKDLRHVDLDTALSLLDVNFPETYSGLDGVSAAEFLDNLKFPDRARHLALEVFARSFFADPREFSAGELVAMFHAYFLGSAEGLLFDVPRDDFETSLWGPLSEVLTRQSMHRVQVEVTRLERVPGSDKWRAVMSDGSTREADAVVLATGPEPTQRIIEASSEYFNSSEEYVNNDESAEWMNSLRAMRNAPPFAVLRLWYSGHVNADRPAFLGTTGYGQLDNISVLERFEAGAAAWSEGNGGSVVELHAYAIDEECYVDPERQSELRGHLLEELHRVYPETTHLKIVAEELLIERDCPLISTNSFSERLGVSTPFAGLTLAGDWVRCDLPIALMERAATTGWMAANELLADWGIAGHDLWSVPTKGRHWWPKVSRKMLAKLPGSKSRQ